MLVNVGVLALKLKANANLMLTNVKTEPQSRLISSKRSLLDAFFSKCIVKYKQEVVVTPNVTNRK